MTKERIEDFREIILPFVKKRLLEINYENLGKSDAEEFARDFNEILDWAIKALEPTTKNNLGVDWESYKDIDGNCLDDLILEVLQNNFDCGNTYGYKVADKIIGLLPSVTQEPKTGHWIEHPHEAGANWEFSMYECSECHTWEEDDSNYCPNCGYRMVEPQESEVEE